MGGRVIDDISKVPSDSWHVYVGGVRLRVNEPTAVRLIEAQESARHVMRERDAWSPDGDKGEVVPPRLVQVEDIFGMVAYVNPHAIMAVRQVTLVSAGLERVYDMVHEVVIARGIQGAVDQIKEEEAGAS